MEYLVQSMAGHWKNYVFTVIGGIEFWSNNITFRYNNRYYKGMTILKINILNWKNVNDWFYSYKGYHWNDDLLSWKDTCDLSFIIFIVAFLNIKNTNNVGSIHDVLNYHEKKIILNLSSWVGMYRNEILKMSSNSWFLVCISEMPCFPITNNKI